MRHIIKIEHTQDFLDKDLKKFYRTYAIADDGSEVTGFSRESAHFDLNDKIEVFLHRNTVKMRHSPNFCPECAKGRVSA